MASISAIGSPHLPPLTSSPTISRTPLRRGPHSLLSPEAQKPSDIVASGGSSSNVVDRRKLLLSSIGVVATAFCSKEAALASQFADMPAIRGKDYV